MARFSRPTKMAAALLTCLLIAAVVVPALSLHRDTSLPIPLPPGVSTTVPHVPTLVAIGDSYTAGAGVQPYATDSTADMCWRSDEAYPLRTARALGIPGRTVACSGATSDAFMHPYKGEGPQLERIGNPDIVVFTIGGNDAQALQTLSNNPLGALDPAFLDNFQRDHLDPLGKTLDKAFADVHKTAPNAQVFVLGYPNVFPATADEYRYCAGLQLPLGPSAYTLPVTNLRTLNVRLNQVVADAAKRADFTFVDVAPAFETHDVCAQYRLIWGTEDAPRTEGILHPTADGQRVFGDVLTSAIRAKGIPGLPPQ